MNIDDVDFKNFLNSIKKEKKIQYNEPHIEKQETLLNESQVDMEKKDVILPEMEPSISKNENSLEEKNEVSVKKETSLDFGEISATKNESSLEEKNESSNKKTTEIIAEENNVEKNLSSIDFSEEEVSKNEISIEPDNNTVFKEEKEIDTDFSYTEKENVEVFADYPHKDKAEVEVVHYNQEILKTEIELEDENETTQKNGKDLSEINNVIEKTEIELEDENEIPHKNGKDLSERNEHGNKETENLNLKGNDFVPDEIVEIDDKEIKNLKLKNNDFVSTNNFDSQEKYVETFKESFKSGRGDISLQGGSIAGFSFFNWKTVEENISKLTHKKFRPTGSVRQILSSGVGAFEPGIMGNTDPMYIATNFITSIGSLTGSLKQSSKINLGRYDLTPLGDYDNLKREKDGKETKPVYVDDGNPYYKFPQPAYSKGKPLEKEKNLVLGKKEDGSDKTFDDGVEGKKKEEGTLVLGKEDNKPKAFKEEVEGKKKEEGNLILGKEGNEPKAFKEEEVEGEKKEEGNLVLGKEGNESKPFKEEEVEWEEKAPEETKKLNTVVDGKVEEFDPESAKIDQEENKESEEVDKSNIIPENDFYNRSEKSNEEYIKFKLKNNETNETRERFSIKRLTENLQSIGQIYVSPVNIDYLNDSRFAKIPLQSNLVNSNDSRKAQYKSTDFLGRVGSVKQYVNTESVSYSLETKYFVTSDSNDGGYTMENLQKIESMYKSLVYPKYKNNNANPNEMNISFNTRPPIINIVIGENGEGAPSISNEVPKVPEEFSSVINNFFTNVYSISDGEKRVEFKYFIVTEVNIEKDYETTPFYIEVEKESSSEQIKSHKARDLMGFTVKLSVTEIDPNYFGVLPTFNDYVSFSMIGANIRSNQI